MANEILIGGLEVVVIAKGPYKDMKGKIVKVMHPRSDDTAKYKVRFDRNYGSSKDTFYRWLEEKDLIPVDDPAYGLIFGD